MIALFKRFILSTLEKSRIGRRYLSLYGFKHHLEDIGWFKSYENHLPVDRSGQPLPWYTYPAINFLLERVKPQMSIFEYGSGNSTLWWSAHVASIVSIEHDLSWFESMKKKVPSNVEYRYCEQIDGGQYCKIVTVYDKQFDVIVIDGRDRVNCAKNSLNALSYNGIIIWDNSDRDAYIDGYRYLLDSGFKRLDFHGYGPVNQYSWCTSIFYRDDNCFGL